MKLWHRVGFIITAVAVFITVISLYVYSIQIDKLIKQEDTHWSASFSQVLARAIMNDTLEGKPYQTRNLLRRIKGENPEITYLLVVGFDKKPFVSTFDVIPSFLLKADHSVCKKGEINEYYYNGIFITDFCNPLVEKLDAHLHVGINYDAIHKYSDQGKLIILIAVTFITIIGILFGGLLGRRISRPIEALSNAVKSYARKETFPNIPFKGEKSEVGELISSFEEMVDQRARDERELYTYRNQLESLVQQRTKELELEIEKHKQTENKLDIARKEAESANSAKTVFLSQMSHELRTPMNAILGFAQLLEFDVKENSLLYENVKEIRIAGDHLLQLINEILDLSHIESGELKLSLKSVNWSDIINECIKLTNSQTVNMDVDINFNIIDDKAQYVLADRLRLKQITLNLLSNAIKYNKPGGRVDILLNLSSANHSHLTITDTGVGISEENKNAIFEPFNRLTFGNSDIEGAGIGLIICQRLVNAMHGKLEFDSKLGVGSKFQVSLPVCDSD